MIGNVTVRVSAQNPSMPIGPVAVVSGSACTVGVLDVPSKRYGATVTGVTVSITNADGETVSVPATRVGCAWCASFGPSHLATPGSVRGGITVSAGGTAEDGSTPLSWILGVGDVCVMSADAVPAPGMTWQDVHLRDSVPAEPVKGDLAHHDDGWKIWTGEAWSALGSGGGGSVVESEENPGYAAHADHADTAGHADHADLAESANRASFADSATSAEEADTVPWSGVRGAPDFAEKTDLAVVMDLVGDGTAAHPYAVQLDGVTQSFFQVKTLADTRNAIIRHGRGTYRVTYVGQSEMMWDCTGTVQGEVQTGQIHIFADGDVVQLVAAKELAAKSAVDAVSAMAAYSMSDVVGGALKDRTINHALEGGTFTFPSRTGSNARDFVLVIDALSRAPTVTFPGTPPFQYVSDQPADEVWTADAGKVNAWYFSEISDGVFMVSHKVMDYVAQ